MKNLRLERKISSRGQVVIPKAIRNTLNLKPGKRVEFKIDGDRVIISPASGNSNFLDEFLDTPKLQGTSDGKRIKEIIDEQYKNDLH